MANPSDGPDGAYRVLVNRRQAQPVAVRRRRAGRLVAGVRPRHAGRLHRLRQGPLDGPAPGLGPGGPVTTALAQRSPLRSRRFPQGRHRRVRLLGRHPDDDAGAAVVRPDDQRLTGTDGAGVRHPDPAGAAAGHARRAARGPLGARRVTIAGDLADAVLVAAVPTLYFADLLPFWALLAIVALVGCVASAYLSAQRMLLTETVGSDEGAVTAANALFETATSSARLVGPAVAGFLIAGIGALNVLWVDAVSFAVSAALLTGLPRGEPAQAPLSANHMAEGARYLFRDPVLRTMSLAVLGYGTLMPVVLLALPVMARSRYDANPHVVGWLLAAWGGGTALGTVIVARLARRIPPTRFAACGSVGAALVLWLLPWDQPAATAALTVAAGCMFLPAVTAPAVALLTLRPPEHLRPHVVPVFGAAVYVASPVAYAVAGVLFEHLAVGTVLVAVAVGASLCALVLLNLVRRPAD